MSQRTGAHVVDRATNLRTRKVEQWAATFPGGWYARRVEDAGTTWDLVLEGHDGCLTHLPSLQRIAELIDSGAALAALDQKVADATRPRCTWRGRWTAASCGEFAAPASDRCTDPRHQEA